MSAKAGRGGKVMVGANTVAFVETWTADISDELYDTSGLGSTSRTYVPQVLPAEGWTINWRALDNSDTATAAIRGAILAGTGLTLLLYEDSTKYWTSAASGAFVSNFSQSVGVDGLVTGSCSGQFSGGVTYN